MRSAVESNPEVESTYLFKPTIQGNTIMDNLVCHSEPEPAPLQMSQSILNVDAAVLPPVSHTYVNPNELHGRQPQAINFAS